MDAVENQHPKGNPILQFDTDISSDKAFYPALGVKQGEDFDKEIVYRRSPFSKTYEIGDGVYKVILDKSPIHYFDNTTSSYEEIDLRFVEEEGKWRVRKAPFFLEVFTDRVGYYLRQSDGKEFSIEL